MSEYDRSQSFKLSYINNQIADKKEDLQIITEKANEEPDSHDV